jgi:hypothetical protein
MKQLTQYRKHGHDFLLIKRSGNVGLFKESKYNSYELIIIQSHNGREIMGNIIPPQEYPPSNEQWGSKGWTFTIEADALKNFDELCEIALTSKRTKPTIPET